MGRFDPERAKARLQDSFSPEHTRFIVSGTERTGFYALRPTPEGWQLDHLTCFRRSKVGDRSGGDEGDFS